MLVKWHQNQAKPSNNVWFYFQLKLQCVVCFWVLFIYTHRITKYCTFIYVEERESTYYIYTTLHIYYQHENRTRSIFCWRRPKCLTSNLQLHSEIHSMQLLINDHERAWKSHARKGQKVGTREKNSRKFLSMFESWNQIKWRQNASENEMA